MDESTYTSRMGLHVKEIEEGWHYCVEFDGLLVGPGMGELGCCSCLPKEHTAYKTIPVENYEFNEEDPFNPPENQSPDPP